MTTLYKGYDGLSFVQPTYIDGFGRWVGKITVPADGDYNSEATFAPGYQGLTDRTTWLAWRCIDIVGGGTYDNEALQFNGFFLFAGEADFYDLRCTSDSWPTLEPARSWERHSLELMATTRLFLDDPQDSSTKYPDAWKDIIGGDEVIETRSTDQSNNYTWIRLRDLPDGGLLTAVKVASKGLDYGSLPTLATFRVARRKGRGAIEYLAAAVSDSHDAGNYTSTELQTTVFTGSHTIDKGYVYFLIVRHMYASSAAGGMHIYDVESDGTAGRLGL